MCTVYIDYIRFTLRKRKKSNLQRLASTFIYKKVFYLHKEDLGICCFSVYKLVIVFYY